MPTGEERRQSREGIVWRLYNEGWFAGNLDLMRDLLDPGIVWTAIEDAPDAGTYRGYEGVRAYWQDWLDDFEMHGASIEESIEAGDRLVCVQRAATTGKGSGVRSELHYACVYRLVRDSVVRTNAVRAGLVLRKEPVDQKIANEELIPRHMPEEQRLPDGLVATALGELDEGAIAALRVKAAVEDLTDITRPVLALGADGVVALGAYEVLELGEREVPPGERGVCFLDQRALDDRERGDDLGSRLRHAQSASLA